MDTRVHEVLDGERQRAELDPSAANTLQEAEKLIRDVVGAVPNPPLPDLGSGVFVRIAALESSRQPAVPDGRESSNSLIGWLLASRPLVIRWRPAYALGMVAAVALFLMVQPPSPESSVDAGPTTARVFVQFRLDAPLAQHVALAGDFTDWKPAYTMRRSEPGVWTVVVPLDPGVHDYAFVVDGQRWIADPMAPAVADGFGGLNSRLAVLAPDAGTGT